MIPSNDLKYIGAVSFDITVGMNTKLVFKYSHDVDVSIITSDDNEMEIVKDTEHQLIVVRVEGQVVRL